MNYYFKILLLIIFSPFLLLMVILSLSNFLQIRFYSVSTNRIGHLVEDFNLILAHKKKVGGIFIDIVYLQYPEICNQAFFDNFYKNNFIFVPKIIGEYFFLLFQKLSKKNKFFFRFFPHRKNSKKSGYQFLSCDDKINIKIPEYINEKGKKFLSKLGTNSKKIVCINIWNDSHIDSGIAKNHHSHRNGNFQSYIASINYLISKGFFVIKVGRSNIEEKINNKNFFDYSFNSPNDELDLFLVSNCYLYISNSTGLDHLAFALEIPMLINAPVIFDFFVEKKYTMYLLRPHYSNDLKRELSYNEIIEKNLPFQLKSSKYEENGVVIKDNDESDILLACKDMLTLIENNFKVDKNNYDLSVKFWKIFMKAKENIAAQGIANHNKDLEYYKSIEINSFYSWSYLKKKPELIF